MIDLHKKLKDKTCLTMGIINVTPDSFSGDGVISDNHDYVAAALQQAETMIRQGADILDIGGESSRPGSVTISAEEESHRVIPVIQKLAEKYGLSTIISVDTVKAAVAEQAIKSGAHIINDVSAVTSPDMAQLAVKTEAYFIVMDNRSKPKDMTNNPKIGGNFSGDDSIDIVQSVVAALKRRAEIIIGYGVAKEKIILDPGIGFGKTVGQNLVLIRELPQLKKLGYPVMIGPSRKSFIGQILDVSVDDRLEGTAALVALSVSGGADIVRVHDVGFMSRVATVAATLVRSA